ncbi:uncharacterized protein BX664DRAFT_347261 [Halteromyces radiatus]|uniref:uncharacterized protein n=1 Tax=Halteromyces radiatus TaxID=101107 RepID=UPI00221FB6AA|nr:uncharacterized protein BX664DRAFT_347261 [Halteromyces radiatus]KAI8097272.1 hypothetical protein BX664DRAFT_347261 [Halteromyces radiatus]
MECSTENGNPQQQEKQQSWKPFMVCFIAMMVFISFLPAAEVMKQAVNLTVTQEIGNNNNNNNSLLPSPMLSPHVSLSSDDEIDDNEPMSPPPLTQNGFQLDDLLDWEGQQTV